MNSKPIEGVQVIPITRHSDDRGYFSEVFRDSWLKDKRIKKRSDGYQLSYTEAYPKVIKSFHMHKLQFDYWFVVKGNIQIGLVDLRRASRPTQTIFIGEDNPQGVLIPPSVAHGYKVLGEKSAGLFYLTSKEYNAKKPDEYRYDWNEFGYDWETKNR